jgi:hypothetical protein
VPARRRLRRHHRARGAVLAVGVLAEVAAVVAVVAGKAIPAGRLICEFARGRGRNSVRFHATGYA